MVDKNVWKFRENDCFITQGRNCRLFIVLLILSNFYPTFSYSISSFYSLPIANADLRRLPRSLKSPITGQLHHSSNANQVIGASRGMRNTLALESQMGKPKLFLIADQAITTPKQMQKSMESEADSRSEVKCC